MSEPSSASSSSSLPAQIAAIDMGSNSFHMVVAKTAHGEIRTLDQLGEKVQLAAGLDSENKLSEEAQERALACLSKFRQRIRELDASCVQVVGTNALRVAKNRTSFIRKAEKLVGFPIEIISGREEARLIYLGVSHTLSDDSGNRLVIDIGGGSTEFIIGERFEALELESLHMGCVSYRERYFKDGSLSKSGFKRAITDASREILNIQRKYCALGWESAVGSSGSIKAVFQALAHLGMDKTEVNLESLKVLKSHLIKLGHIDRLSEIGVKKERASIFAAGFSILYAAFKTLGINSMEYTSGALREGLLYDTIGRIRHEDVRERSVYSMSKRYDVDEQHSERVEETVICAYQQVALNWGIESQNNELLLRWASRLFEVGMAISHTQYHKHGAYLILHSDLPGFTRLTQLHLSTLVRAHRRKLSNSIFENMKDSERLLLTKLSIIFRLSVILTSSRISSEKEFKLSCKDKNVCLELGESWLENHPLTLANLENEKSYLRQQGYDLKIG